MADDTRLRLLQEPDTGPDCANIQHVNDNTLSNVQINIQQPTARTDEQTDDLITDDNPDIVAQDTLKVPDRSDIGAVEDDTDEQSYNEKAEVGEKNEKNDEDEQYDTEEEEEKRMAEENRLIDELKREMHNAVKDGDVFRLEDLLNNPHADIKMTWYNENLLVTALKAGEEFMAEYLIDNGVDYNFQLVYLDLKDVDDRKNMEWYKISCRQLAFDKEMLGIVELIDLKKGELFNFVRPACRVPKIWQPKPIEIENEDEDVDEDEENDEEKQTTILETENERKTEEAKQPKATIKPSKSLSVLSDVDSGQYSERKSQASHKRVTSVNNIEQASVVQAAPQFCSSPDEGYETTSPILSSCGSPLGKRSKFRSVKKYFNAPTKSSIIKANWTSSKQSAMTKVLPDVFQTYKVVSPGSYHYESKLWRAVKEKDKNDNIERSDTLPEMSDLVRTQSPWRNDVTSSLNNLSSKIKAKQAPASPSRRSSPHCYDDPEQDKKHLSLKRQTRSKVIKCFSYDWTGKSLMKREQTFSWGQYSAVSRSTNSSLSSKRILRSGSKILFRPLTM